ncbi:MAG TPA: histidine kinase dimerization/phospho-acceptor domain-containing protein [Thermoanaerobaculia bacterium]|nr:histidine kinase dimerization/phospho-acceptor domain-containing protein [Thermoanaerobaculia bacterium]
MTRDQSGSERFSEAIVRRSVDVAHDLKTPLNIAVLNLELLRMQVQKVGGENEKTTAYCQVIDRELRRVGQIIDTFFRYAVPPEKEPLQRIVAAPRLEETAGRYGFKFARTAANSSLVMHESRFLSLVQQLFEGAAKIFLPAETVMIAKERDGWFRLTLEGPLSGSDRDLGKIFKYYCTDPSGNADLSLVSARTIAETYGGRLDLIEAGPNSTLVLELPTGD